MKKKLVVVIVDTNRFFAHGLSLAIEAYGQQHNIDIDISHEIARLPEAYLAFVADTLPPGIPRTPSTCRHARYYHLREAPLRRRDKREDGVIFRQQQVTDLWSQINLALLYCTTPPFFREKKHWKPVIQLTQREYDVIYLLSLGLSPIAASRLLDVNEKTISAHKRNAMKKLHFIRNTELHQWLQQGGLVTSAVRGLPHGSIAANPPQIPDGKTR